MVSNVVSVLSKSFWASLFLISNKKLEKEPPSYLAVLYESVAVECLLSLNLMLVSLV